MEYGSPPEPVAPTDAKLAPCRDLFHTLTGYGVDLNGEAGVLAFTFGQTDWDRLLGLPIEEARAELGISPLEPYRPLELEDAFGSSSTGASSTVVKRFSAR